MAQVIHSTFVITVSKLVKNNAAQHAVLDSDQIAMITETLPGILEELLADSAAIIEVQPITD
jgi:hypothetical protein